MTTEASISDDGTNQKSAADDPTQISDTGVSRRSLLQKAAGLGAGMLAGGFALNAAKGAFATVPTTPRFQANVMPFGPGPTPGDIAILKFLAVAELVEDDLWSQYTELARGNPPYIEALNRIDTALPDYINQDRDDERSHANFINAYLQSIGQEPINLDAFRTIIPPKVPGLAQVGRLTNLTNLSFDTSWYNRYRSTGNPDLGDTFPQLVVLKNVPTIPTNTITSGEHLQFIASTACLHFCAIEQGGASLYNCLLSQITDLGVLSVVASIGPTEFYHFGVFQTSLENLFQVSSNGITIPDLRRDKERANKVMPTPCAFLSRDFPLCSILRPRDPVNASPLAAAGGLAASGLLTDPNNPARNTAFINAAVALATDATNAMRAPLASPPTMS